MMYSFSITQQLVVFMQSFGFGFVVGLLHSLTDFIFGLIIPTKRKYIIADTVFCIIFALLLFCFVLAYNLGKLRLYLILGLCFGVAVYSLSLGDLISRVLSTVQGWFLKLMNLLFAPFRFIWNGLKKIRHNFEKKLNKSIAKENKSGV